MIKILIALVIAVGVFVFTTPGQKLTASILDKVSPAAQEKQLLTDLQKNIDGISTTVNGLEYQKLNDSEKLKQLNVLIEQTKTKAQVVQGALKQGDLSATASMLIQKIASIKTSDQPTAVSPLPTNNCPNP